MRRGYIVIILAALFFRSFGQNDDSLKLMIGQMIMIGINDYDDPGEKYDLLGNIKAGYLGGIILYEKNLDKENTSKKLAELILELQEDAKTPLFMSIDEEGGRVNRLKPKYGFPKTRSAAYLGDLDNIDSTYFYAEQTAKLLSGFGFNVNYAPVIDVNVNTSNPVIGKLERSYSEDYREVTRHAAAFIKAHTNYGIATTLKHFPGHGSSADDTHLGIADVTDTWRIEELYPYRFLIDSGVVTGVMTAHIVNGTLDQQKLPATLSNKIINGMLRDFLNYEGVVFSDDMHMGAISANYGFEDAVVMAINAGVDVLMFSNNVFDYQLTTVTEIHELIFQKVKSGQISTGQIQASFQRIMKLKSQLGLLEKDYNKELKRKLKNIK